MTGRDVSTRAGAGQASLDELERSLDEAGRPAQPARPPVHLWNPPDCGQIPMQIKRDGSWWHEGSPIKRARLVALFASILRKEGEDFYLVTPVEKWRIEVEDVPFLAVELLAEGPGDQQRLDFRTQFGDVVTADSDHPIRVTLDERTGEPSPYVMIRDGLEARLTRPVFYELVDLAVEDDVGGLVQLGVWSAGDFFVLGQWDERMTNE